MNVQNNWAWPNLILAIAIASAAAVYVITAWHKTTLAVHISHIFSILTRRPEQHPLRHVQTQKEWKAWAALNLPSLLYSFLACGICEIPYATAAALLLLVVGGVVSPLEALLAWPIAAGITVRMITNASANIAEVSPPAVTAPTMTRTILPDAPTQLAQVSPRQKTPTTGIQTADEIMEGGGPAVPAHLERQAKLTETSKRWTDFHDRFGVKVDVRPDGSRVVQQGSIPEELKQILKLFVPEEPCWFEGCEELRAAHARDLAAAGGENCTECTEGDLNRKYMLLASDLIKKSATKISNSGTV